MEQKIEIKDGRGFATIPKGGILTFEVQGVAEKESILQMEMVKVPIELTEEQKAHNELVDKYKMYPLLNYNRNEHSRGTRKGSRKRVGFSAQQVQEVMLDLFGTDNYGDIVNDSLYGVEAPEGLESKKTMAYSNIIPFLVGAIQELTKEIETLKNK